MLFFFGRNKDKTDDSDAETSVLDKKLDTKSQASAIENRRSFASLKANQQASSNLSARQALRNNVQVKRFERSTNPAGSSFNTNRATSANSPLKNTSSLSSRANLNTTRANTTLQSTTTLQRRAETNRVNSVNAATTAASATTINKESSAIGGRDVSSLQYKLFCEFLEKKTGIVLGEGKQYLVNSRLQSLLTRFNVDRVDELIQLAIDNKLGGRVQDTVIDAMTTNETLWFRDTYPYLALEQIILPELAKNKNELRIWSAACASGQEPYSISMVILEQLGKLYHFEPSKVKIVGTDISNEMLAKCRQGRYDNHALSRGLAQDRRNKYFVPNKADPNTMLLKPEVKNLVEFRSLNLLGSFSLMGKFDVIFCRNVLIYFSNEVKTEILTKLTHCLNPGGYLILGSSETITGIADKYQMVRCNRGIIYKLK